LTKGLDALRQAHRRQPGDRALHHVARHHRADVFRRAAVDDVARHQLERLAEPRDLLGDTPDHVAQVGVLLDRTVDLERDRTLGEVADLRHPVDRPDRRRAVEALADLPRLLLVAHRPLQVAPGHVEADRVAKHHVERLLVGDVAPALVERRDQLDLVVVVLGQGRVGMIGGRARGDELDRVARLLEEERRLAVRVRPHLARVRRVVEADAVDSPHREHLARADDRQHRLGDAEHGARAAGTGRSGRAAGTASERGQAAHGACRQHFSSIHRLSPAWG